MIKPPTSYNNIYDLINGIASYIIWIAIPIATIMIIFGAYQILFSTGDPAKVKKGRDTILYSLVGLMVALLVKGIISIIKQVLGVNN